MDNSKDSLIVLSGGMDSVSMLYEYAPRIALAVSFNYGSNHNVRELECAARNCALLGIEHIVIPLDFMHKYYVSSLLEGAGSIPDGDYAHGNLTSTVVPFRNGVMLSVACGLAASRGLNSVMIANHGGDHEIYPDCRPEFIQAMSLAMTLGTYEKTAVFAPYTSISKSEIARRGAAAGVDFSLTYSCYRGGEIHCGTCATCRERRQAFADAGIPDPTVYRE